MSGSYPNDEQARELILEIGRRMYARGMVAANDGNISVKVSEDEIWVTPTGVSKGFMRAEQLVKMRLDGSIVSMGELGPSSEVKMHLRVYNENPRVGGVAHAHPPIATSFAIAGLALDAPIYPEAVVNLGAVPCAGYETPGSQGVPDSIAPFCRDYNAVLLGSHGALTWGEGAMEAFYRMEALEHYAAVTLYSGVLGRASVLSQAQIEQLLALRREASGAPDGAGSFGEFMPVESRLSQGDIERIAQAVADMLKEDK